MFLEMKNIKKNFDGFEAVRDVSFEVEQGRLAALLGPSGSGKTTLLRILAGLEMQDAGDVFVDGICMNDIPAGKRGIGFVFQNYALFRHMTVYENIAFGLKVQKMKKAKIRERVEEMLSLIGLTGLEKRYPSQLSGGQCQRVAFARAIAPSPRLLLLDEPFAAIDAKVRKELREWLREMIGRVGITSLFVTHDQEEALEVADEILIINEGKLEQKGSPADIYLHPKTPFVAQFAGNSVIVDGLGDYPGFEKVPADGKVIIRPEFAEAFKKDNQEMLAYSDLAEDGVVESVTFHGDSLEVRLLVRGLSLLIRRSLERRPIAVGEHLNVFLYRILCINGDETQIYENERLKDMALS